MPIEELRELHAKIDSLTAAFQNSAEQRATLSAEMKQVCSCLNSLNEAVMGENGIRARLTRAEGKIAVGQWLIVTIGGAFLTAITVGIWQIASRV